MMWPFSRHAVFSPAKDIEELTGKVILVTGGNAGIGQETVLQLAVHEPERIFLASRDESKAKEAIMSIKAQVDRPIDIDYIPLDLSSLSSVKAAALMVVAATDRLDLLILNAGVMALPPEKTRDGFEIQMGINHIGHFYLTKLLLPILEQTVGRYNSDVRVITVASNGYNMAPSFNTFLSTEELCKEGPIKRYGASKAANILFAAELARRHPGLISVSLHPGTIQTELYAPIRESNSVLRYLLTWLGPIVYQDVQVGALNQLWLSTVLKERLSTGGYYEPIGKLQHLNKYSNDIEMGKQLWDWTGEELSKRGF